MTDPIADMLTRIRNANALNHSQVRVPYSKAKAAIADVLKDSGYIEDVALVNEPKTEIELTLRKGSSKSRISELHRVSKPGRRVYVASNEVPRVLRGRGIAIVSTSSGIMTDHKAREAGIGGELMCKVW